MEYDSTKRVISRDYGGIDMQNAMNYYYDNRCRSTGIRKIKENSFGCLQTGVNSFEFTEMISPEEGKESYKSKDP